MSSKNNGLVVGVIAVAVAVVIITGLLIPTISNSSSDKSYQKNTGSYFSLVGDDGTEHTIVVSAGNDGFIITTDGERVITPNLATYNPGGVKVAGAVGIGIYEAYNDDGVLVSQSGQTPTASQNIDAFRTQALANNSDVTNGTYQLWNYYQYTMYKLMALTIMGNTDSQYMMGPGKSSTTGGNGPNTTGLTTSAYTKSAASSDSVSMLIENSWGSVWEFIGDTSTANYVLKAGNTLGGNSVVNNKVQSTLTETITVPSNGNSSWIDTIYTSSEGFGVPKTIGESAGTDGEAINDTMWSNNGNRVVLSGGSWNDGAKDGLSAWLSHHALSLSAAYFGGRLAYVIPDGGSPSETAPNYGYVITYSEGGATITNVEALVDGVLTAEMPTGTTLNTFWNFDSETGIGPFGCYYALINLASGENADDSTEERLSTTKGEIAYILDPSDWTKTLAGNSFDATLYNAMLIVPTMYWYSDEEAGKLYMGSSPDVFNGITMTPYAHTYTVDPSIDTGNPVTTSSTSLVIGEDAIVRLFETGDVLIINTTTKINLGKAVGSDTVTFTVTDDVLRYTTSTNATGSFADVLAYISSDGEMAMCRNPYVTDESKIILGGYAYDLATTTDDTVDIGYCASGTVEGFGDANVTGVMAPVSDASNTYSSTTVVTTTSDVESDLKRIDKIVFTGTWSDNGESTATYTYFLAPSNVAYTNENYAGDQIAALLNIVPLLVIIGVIIGAVALIRMRN